MFTISLVNTKPLVWRKFLAHEFIELPDLHMLIQMTMGWEDRHLYSFEINKKTYSDGESAAEMNNLDDEGILLSDILGNTKKFIYTYDFGDHWVHQVEITQELDHDPRMNYPICIGGFEQLKAILQGKTPKKKMNCLRGWVDFTTRPHLIQIS